MEHSCTACEKKLVGKARSCNGPPLRLRGERPLSGAGAGGHEARSLYLALGRAKRPRLSPAPYSAASPRPISVRRGNTITDMFTDTKNTPSAMDNASLISMDFSHYELLRNLSRSNCNSDGAAVAVSSSASTFGPGERSMKDEHLERYFRSVEMWSRRCRDGPSNIRFNIPEN